MRRAHRLLGFAAAPWALFYLAGALQFEFAPWLLPPPAASEHRAQLPPGLSAREAALRLRADHGLRGELAPAETLPASLRLRFSLPGEEAVVRYTPASGETSWTLRRWGPWALASRLHVTAGLWHHSAALQLFGAAAGLFALTLLATALTGLVLWWRRAPHVRDGAWLVAALSLLWALGSLAALRLS